MGATEDIGHTYVACATTYGPIVRFRLLRNHCTLLPALPHPVYSLKFTAGLRRIGVRERS